MHKIFGISLNFHVKYRTTIKYEFLFFSSFLLVLTNFLVWEEGRPLGYNSMNIFVIFPNFLRSLVLSFLATRICHVCY